MKNLIKFLGISIVLFTFAANSFGQITSTANATATIQAPLTITPVNPLNFGTLASSGGGTVVVATDNSITPSAGVTVISGTPTAASFDVTGIPSATFSINLPNATITLTSGGNTMSVGTFVRTPAADGTLTVGGTATIVIGGTLTVAAGQAAGVYTNATDLDVTINYN